MDINSHSNHSFHVAHFENKGPPAFGLLMAWFFPQGMSYASNPNRSQPQPKSYCNGSLKLLTSAFCTRIISALFGCRCGLVSETDPGEHFEPTIETGSLDVHSRLARRFFLIARSEGPSDIY